MNISLKQSFYGFITVAGFFAFLYFGRPVLVSIAISILMAFILYPICSRLEKWGVGRISAAFISLVGVAGLLFGLFYLFSTQIISFMSEFSDFGQKLSLLAKSVVRYFNNNIAIVPEIETKDLISRSQEWVEESGGDIMSGTLSQTADFLSGFLMVTVYTFLFLIYRTGLLKVAVKTAAVKHKGKVKSMAREMQKVGQQYLVGMAIMIAIIGTANSIALLSFGIDHAILFGFLAALLAIIPYVGTTLGATIPTLYAFMTHDSLLIPLGVVLAFWVIQLIESNFLSPKIVGGNLNINALAAIIALIIGGYLWGVAGMALSLPFAAILRVFSSYITPLKPLSLLLGSELYEKENTTNINQIKSEIKKVIKKEPERTKNIESENKNTDKTTKETV